MQATFEQFIKASEVFPAAIIMTDAAGHIVQVNGQTANMFGYAQAELLGETVEVLMPARYRALHIQHRFDFSRAPRTRLMGLGLDLVGQRKNGDEFPIEVSLSPVVLESNTLVIAMVHDVTARKSAEEARKQSDEQYRLLFEHAVFGIFRIDGARRISNPNPTLAWMLGYESQAAFLQECSGMQLLSESQWQQLMEKSHGRDHIGSLDAVWCRKDGKNITVRLSGRAIREAHGNALSLEMFAEDVTQRVALEEQLRHSQKMEVVGQMADSIVHDFNNLISVISAQSELLLDMDDGNDDVRREAEIISSTADRAAALANQLLAFSRKQEIEPKVFNLNLLLRDIDRMLARLVPQGIEFRLSLASDLGNILADPNQTEQVVVNLIVNARDAMPNGGKLVVETANSELDDIYARDHLEVKAGPYVRLTVSDSGVGMNAEVRAHIFEPFFTTKPSGKGPGLGLSTVYAIVKKASGHISFYSQLNKGTVFEVYFPRVDAAALKQDTKQAPPAFKAAGVRTILLVVEEEHLQLSIKQMLERAGYAVLAASNDSDALQLVEQWNHGIALVLSDVEPDRPGGQALAKQIRSQRPSIQFLYMSCSDEDSLRGVEALHPAGRFLQKPFRKAALLRKIAELLR